MKDKEDNADMLSLKASLHDNLIYYSYGTQRGARGCQGNGRCSVSCLVATYASG